MNNVNLIGRLTRDPELNTTQTGKTVANFSIAINRRFNKDETDFFDCTAWGKTAEIIGEYLRKGNQVGINGELRQDRFEVEGQKRSKIKINVNQIDFIGSKQEAGNNQENKTVVEGEAVSDDEFPFN